MRGQWPPLHSTVRFVRDDEGNTDVIKLLLVRGADINAHTDSNEITPLHGAVYRWHLDKCGPKSTAAPK